MEVIERTHRSSEGKLVAFPAPSAVLHTRPEDLPHDVGVLRRPVVLESAALPRLDPHDGLVHDARNLVTSLEMLSTILAEPGVLTGEHSHYAEDLKAVTKALSSLLVRVSNSPAAATAGPIFSREPLRASRTPKEMRASEVLGKAHVEGGDTGLMVKSCEPLLAAIAGPKVSLQISYDRGLGQLAMREEDLTRVLINLVKNAGEALPKGGRVAITVRKALGLERAALINVEDNGVGIPAHALGQIFQAGFTSKGSAGQWPAAKHRGLGLTIARDIVEGAGGRVRVTSTLKKGTIFEIKLPCKKA